MHGKNRLILIHERKVTDLTLGEPDRLLQREVRDLLHRCIGQLAQMQKGFQTGLFETQCRLCLLALFFQSDTLNREADVCSNLFKQASFFLIKDKVSAHAGDH